MSLPPKPVADQDTQPFWDGVSDRKLRIQRCTSCERWIWQPRPLCSWCHSTKLDWIDVSGNGTIASWTVLHPPVLEVWKDKLPLVVLLVELDEGVRMIGQLVDSDGVLMQSDSALEMGARVALRWRIDEAGQTLPAWTLASP
ncbi:MAG: Zn-ribbon domain-containing OB-fold protein [Actinomycetota bacterium]